MDETRLRRARQSTAGNHPRQVAIERSRRSVVNEPTERARADGWSTSPRSQPEPIRRADTTWPAPALGSGFTRDNPCYVKLTPDQTTLAWPLPSPRPCVHETVTVTELLPVACRTPRPRPRSHLPWPNGWFARIAATRQLAPGRCTGPTGRFGFTSVAQSVSGTARARRSDKRQDERTARAPRSDKRQDERTARARRSDKRALARTHVRAEPRRADDLAS
jgi:hypothetical protein